MDLTAKYYDLKEKLEKKLKPIWSGFKAAITWLWGMKYWIVATFVLAGIMKFIDVVLLGVHY